MRRTPDRRTVWRMFVHRRPSPLVTPSRWATLRRAVLAAVAVPLGFVALLPWWSATETALVGRVLSLAGVEVQRTGRELLLRHGGDPVVLVVVGWCSSLAPVLALVGLASALAGGVRARGRVVIVGVSLLLVGNLVRLSAVGWVASTWDPGSVGAFHDGPATGFAVLVVLVSVGLVVLSAPGARRAAAMGRSATSLDR